MKTLSTKVTVGAEHIDIGDHANWIAQLKIAQDAHFAIRKTLGLELEKLKIEHELFFVMSHVKNISYHRELRLGDTLDVRITMWISRPTSLEFHCLFYKEDGVVATKMNWVMPLTSTKTRRICKIPAWIVEIIGTEKPEL